jgi:hypothetical protein
LRSRPLSLSNEDDLYTIKIHHIFMMTSVGSHTKFLRRRHSVLEGIIRRSVGQTWVRGMSRYDAWDIRHNAYPQVLEYLVFQSLYGM